MGRNNFDSLHGYLTDILDDIDYSLDKLRNEVDDYRNNLIQDRPSNLHEWITTCIELIPDDVDLGTAIKIEELLNNIKE